MRLGRFTGRTLACPYGSINDSDPQDEGSPVAP